MINIRANVFETNSSSVHSLIFVDEPEYTKWANGELYLNRYSEYWWDENKYSKLPRFVTYDEAVNADENFPYPEITYAYDGFNYEDEETGEYKERIFVTLNQFIECCYFDTFDEEHQSLHGDIIHAVGYYGHD